LLGVDIPDTASGFVHREEYVYLPPTWFTGTTSHLALPVVMMIGGEFNGFSGRNRPPGQPGRRPGGRTPNGIGYGAGPRHPTPATRRRKPPNSAPR